MLCLNLDFSTLFCVFSLSKQNLLGRLKQMGECDRRCSLADSNCVCVCLCFCVMWLDVFALVDSLHYILQDSGFAESSPQN